MDLHNITSNLPALAGAAVSIITGVVTVASVITGTTNTPGEDAPAWMKVSYKVIELLGMVTAKAKQ